jgi:hypothetical protein
MNRTLRQGAHARFQVYLISMMQILGIENFGFRQQGFQILGSNRHMT